MDWGKIDFFITWPLISMVFGFLPHAVFFFSYAKIKTFWWLLLGPYVYLCVFEKYTCLGSFGSNNKSSFFSEHSACEKYSIQYEWKKFLPMTQCQ
jgi:hypothetical protein